MTEPALLKIPRSIRDILSRTVRDGTVNEHSEKARANGNKKNTKSVISGVVQLRGGGGGITACAMLSFGTLQGQIANRRSCLSVR